MNREAVPALNQLLADYMVFYQKLRNYHWNVTGPYFPQLHALFETQYTAAALKVDELAERVATLGGRPASTLKEHLELSRLSEDKTVPGAKDMVSNILADLASLNESLRAEAARAGEKHDTATLNLLEGFADEQEKTAWMLRAFLEG